MRYWPNVQKLHSEESIQTQAAINHALTISIENPPSYSTQKDLILTKTLKERILSRPPKERLFLYRKCQLVSI